jgi:hypothetical protein
MAGDNDTADGFFDYQSADTQEGNGHQKGSASNSVSGNDANSSASSAAQSLRSAINSFLNSLFSDHSSGQANQTGGGAAASAGTGNQSGAAANSGNGPGRDEDGAVAMPGSVAAGDVSLAGSVSLEGGAIRGSASGGALTNAVHALSPQPGDGERSTDTLAAMFLHDRMASTSQATSTFAGDAARDAKANLFAENGLSRQSAAPLRVNPAGYLDLSGSEQAADAAPTTLVQAPADEATAPGAETLTPLAADGSARLLDCLPKDAQVLHDAMRRFFDRLDALEEGMGMTNVAKAATGPWLLTGALLTFAGDAARRTVRRASGWTADRATPTEPWDPLPGLGF